jgi:hypothetical protein
MRVPPQPLRLDVEPLSAGIRQHDGELLGQSAELLGVDADAVDIVLILPAPFPGGGLAFDCGHVLAGKAYLLAGDAGVRAAVIVLGAANDAVLVRATANGAIVIKGPGFGVCGDAEAMGHAGEVA